MKRDDHVVPNSDGGWDVKREGANWQKYRTELVEHSKDGKIQDSDSYGDDPRPPRASYS